MGSPCLRLLKYPMIQKPQNHKPRYQTGFHWILASLRLKQVEIILIRNIYIWFRSSGLFRISSSPRLTLRRVSAESVQAKAIWIWLSTVLICAQHEFFFFFFCLCIWNFEIRKANQKLNTNKNRNRNWNKSKTKERHKTSKWHSNLVGMRACCCRFMSE